LAIFRNLAHNISPNYNANETKHGSLLEPAPVYRICKVASSGSFCGWGRGTYSCPFWKSSHVWRHL